LVGLPAFGFFAAELTAELAVFAPGFAAASFASRFFAPGFTAASFA
jgi:hypothetical protein